MPLIPTFMHISSQFSQHCKFQVSHDHTDLCPKNLICVCLLIKNTNKEKTEGSTGSQLVTM